MLGASILLTAVVAAQAVFANPIKPISDRSAYAVKEKHWVPKRWTKVGRAPSDALLNLQIGVKQSSFGELERHLYEGMFPS